MKWSEQILEIFRKVAEENEVEPFQVQDALEHTFKRVKECMQSDDMPKVLLHSFGTFRPTLKNLRKNIAYHQRIYDENPTPETKKRIEQLERVLDRLIQENQTKKHKK